MESCSRPSVLIVDDEAGIRDSLRCYFETNGFLAYSAPDCASALAAMARHPIDVVLLDIGLPDLDGLTLTQRLRQQLQWQGVLIIISGRDELVERVAGLESGADDYVSKPLQLRELLARVRSGLRRARAEPLPQDGLKATVLEFAGMTLDIDGHRLVSADGEEISLSTGEFELLRVMLENPGRVLSRDYLMQRLHGRHAGPFDRAVDVQVGRLRRKLEPGSATPSLIRSIRGTGYLLTAHPRQR